MRYFLDFARLGALGVAVAAGLTGQAHALLIVPSFDGTITGLANAVAYEDAINTAASTIGGLYLNPGTVNIYFKYNASVLGQSNDVLALVPYAQYASQLAFDSATHPSNTVLSTAVANIAKDNTAQYVWGTSAFLRVGMGFVGSGTTPCFNSTGSQVSGCNSVNDGVITIGNVSTASGGAGQNSQAIEVAEHEIDEVLGGGGTGSSVGVNVSQFGTVLGPTDLYRFHSSGSNCASVTSTPSYTTSVSEVACYSIDGGQSALAYVNGASGVVQFNQGGGNSDYGDFVTSTAQIQDAFFSGLTPVFSATSPEALMLDSLAYDPVPEPSTIALFAGAVGGLGWLRRRRGRAKASFSARAPG